MRAAIAAVILAFSVPSGAATADDPSRWWVRCGGPFQLCGHVERETEAPRIPFRYEAAKPFRDGLAAVRIDGRWGYIDRSGDLVIQPAYADAAPFYGNYAEVRVGDAAGVIDRTGRLDLRPQFKRIIPFADDVFIAAPLEPTFPSAGYLTSNTDPETLTSFGGAGLYHLRRGWITEPNLQFTTFAPARGLIWAGGRDEDRDEVWGLMRSDGSWQVTPRYSHVQKLSEKRAIVRALPDKRLPPRERRRVLSGAVDENGVLVVPLQFGWLGYWRGGYGLASSTGGAPRPSEPDGAPNAGLVTLDGVLLAGRYFDEVDVSEDGALPRARIGRVWHSLGPGGELLPDQREGTTVLACPGGPSFIRRGDRVEVRRPDGDPVGLYDDGHLFSRDCPGPFSLKRDDRWFILTPEGVLIGGAQGFENLYGFNGDGAAVKRDGKWGIVDRRGRFTLSPRFDELRPGAAGTYMVGRGDDARWIDAMGRAIPEPRPAPVDPETALACEGGLVRFRANGRWGLRDGDGKTVIRPEHRVVTCFRHGSAWAVAAGAREWCPIGPDGERRRAFLCRQEVYPYVVTHHAPEKFDDDPFESSVLWNVALLDHLAGTRPEAPRWIADSTGRASHSVMDGLPQPELADAAAGPGAFRVSALSAVGAALLAPAAFLIWTRSRRG